VLPSLTDFAVPHNASRQEKPFWIRPATTTQSSIRVPILVNQSDRCTVQARIEYNLAPGASRLVNLAPLVASEVAVRPPNLPPQLAPVSALEELTCVKLFSYDVAGNPFRLCPEWWR